MHQNRVGSHIQELCTALLCLSGHDRSVLSPALAVLATDDKLFFVKFNATAVNTCALSDGVDADIRLNLPTGGTPLSSRLCPCGSAAPPLLWVWNGATHAPLRSQKQVLSASHACHVHFRGIRVSLPSGSRPFACTQRSCANSSHCFRDKHVVRRLSGTCRGLSCGSSPPGDYHRPSNSKSSISTSTSLLSMGVHQFSTLSTTHS